MSVIYLALHLTSLPPRQFYLHTHFIVHRSSSLLARRSKTSHQLWRKQCCYHCPPSIAANQASAPTADVPDPAQRHRREHRTIAREQPRSLHAEHKHELRNRLTRAPPHPVTLSPDVPGEQTRVERGQRYTFTHGRVVTPRLKESTGK